MRSYYTYFDDFISVCPSCLEPNITGNPQKPSDNNYICTGCGASYKRILKVTKDEEDLIHLNEIPKDLGFVKFDEECLSIPLLVKFQNNMIEKSYIENLHNIKGVNIVTWPWRNIRFLPVAISEYLSTNSDFKLVLIGDSPKKFNKHTTSVLDTMKRLFYIENDRFSSELNNKLKQLLESTLFNRRNAIDIRISVHGSHKYTETRRVYDSLNGVKKKLKEEFDNFEWDSKLHGKTLDNTLEVELQKKINRKFPINRYFDEKKWLTEVISNITTIKFPFSGITEQQYQKISDNFIYMDEELKLEEIKYYIERNKPEIVIIQNLDSFYHKFNNDEYFYKYLADIPAASVLCFSVYPEIRGYYKEDESIMCARKYNILFHTWDSEPVLSAYSQEVRNKLHNTDQSFPSPLSSGEYEYKSKKYPGYCCITPDYIKKLEEIKSMPQLRAEDKILYFINYLEKSPLRAQNIKCYYQKGEWLDLEQIYRILMNNSNPLLEEFKERINGLYSNSDDGISNVISIIKEVLRKKADEDIYLIFPKIDNKELLRIVLKEFGNANIKTGNWRSMEYMSDKTVTVISTVMPDYINETKIKYIYFIGSEEECKNFSKVMDYHIVDLTARPLITENYHQLPELLKNIVEPLINIPGDKGINTNDTLKIIKQQIMDNRSYNNSNGRNGTLHAGDELLIFYDGNGEKLILKYGSEILIKNENELSSVRINKKFKLNAIAGKSILMKRKNVFIPFKELFLNLMELYGSTLKFKRNLLEWGSFDELYRDSIQWKNDLNRAVYNYCLSNKVNKNLAIHSISHALAQLNITASREEYIKLWIDDISDDDYSLINIERPNGFEDFKVVYEFLGASYKINVDLYKIRKYYDAILTLQKFRQDILKVKYNINDPATEIIHEKMYAILSMMPVFHIVKVRKGRVRTEINSGEDVNEIMANIEIADI